MNRWIDPEDRPVAASVAIAVLCFAVMAVGEWLPGGGL